MDTREQRLLVNLIKASSAGSQSRHLFDFFDGLDNDGWLIELSRLHLRLVTDATLRHTDFAIALGLRRGRSYRLMLSRADSTRDHILAVARVALKIEHDNAISQLHRTMEFQRLQRQLDAGGSIVTRVRGRKVSASDSVATGEGEQLENMRVKSGLKLKEFAHRIGTSENTYRRKLLEGVVPAEWFTNAKTLIDRRYDAAINRAQDIPRCSDEELQDAFRRVWDTYQRIARPETSLNAITPLTREEQEKLDDAELLKFVPSAEEEMEGVDEDITLDEDAR